MHLFLSAPKWKTAHAFFTHNFSAADVQWLEGMVFLGHRNALTWNFTSDTAQRLRRSVSDRSLGQIFLSVWTPPPSNLPL